MKFYLELLDNWAVDPENYWNLEQDYTLVSLPYTYTGEALKGVFRMMKKEEIVFLPSVTSNPKLCDSLQAFLKLSVIPAATSFKNVKVTVGDAIIFIRAKEPFEGKLADLLEVRVGMLVPYDQLTSTFLSGKSALSNASPFIVVLSPKAPEEPPKESTLDFGFSLN